MASYDAEILLRCSHCKNGLDMESKSFPCLHSFCQTCLKKEVNGETNGNGQCSQCHEIVQLDQLTLSPILVSDLKRQQMESTEWKCDFCLDDGIESIATNWCKNCDKFFCDSCNHFHKKLPKKQHNSTELSGNGKEEVRKAILADMCKSHNEMEDSYCERCNVCLCNTCYMSHQKDSGHCSSHPLSVREEALKKQQFQGPTLLNKIQDFEKDLEERKEKSQIYTEELKNQCHLKCEELWQNYEEIIEEVREKTHEMCKELRRMTEEQVKKWQKFLQETERMLKKLEIWRFNLHHLLKKGPKEKDIVWGVELVARNLESSSPEFLEKINEPLREFRLRVDFSDFWQKFLENLQNKMICSGSLYSSDNFIEFEKEWNLPESNTNRRIESILVSDKDEHIFLADDSNHSIIELKESGELICELILKDEEGNKYSPNEMVFNSSEILGVNCCWWWGSENLIFLERGNFPPFLKIQKIVHKDRQYSFSACKIENKILICNYQNFEIYFYTEKGDYIETIDTGESVGWLPLIRADPSTGYFWGARQDTCEIFCFNENGEKIESFETEEKIWDFFINEFGKIYFCNEEGIFEFFPEINLHKNLHKFKKNLINWPKIFVSNEKIFLLVEIDGKYLIKIFRFVN